MFAKGVPWWCGVDVTDEEFYAPMVCGGLVYRGMIRGKTPSGFIVDFDYPGHNQDSVPIDRCANHLQPNYTIRDIVEVLHRSAPDQPWRWYPAKLLAGSSESFAFVAVDTGGAVVEKIVPVDAVRVVGGLKLYRSQILIRYFEHDLEIPNAGDLGKLASRLICKFVEEGFLKVWNRETSTIGMKLKDGRLFFSSQLGKVQTGYMEKILHRMAKKYLTCEAISSVPVAGTVHPGIMEIDQLDLVDDPITAQLSLDVLYEIFSFLTLIEGVACRKVCQLWNSVLASILGTCLVVDISTVAYRQLATTLHKTLTERTRVLILFDGRDIHQSTPQIQRLHTVKTMLKAMNLDIQFVVLSGARVEAKDLLDSWHSADCCDGLYHFKWRDVCGTLILKNVAVWLPFAKKVSLVIRKEVLDAKMEVRMEMLEKWWFRRAGMDAVKRKLRSSHVLKTQ